MLGRCASIPLALALLLALAAAPVAAQEALPDEPATVLYRAVLELEANGELDLADSIRDYILRRFPDSAAAAALRRSVARVDGRRLDSSGRTELVVWSTLYGLWLGVAVPGALGAEGPEPYGVGLLVGGPLGFMVARRQTRDAPVGDGDAEAISWGGTWGTWQGFGWAHVLDLGRAGCVYSGPDYVYCDEGPSTEAVFAMMLGVGALGTAAGIAVSRHHVIDPGDATTASLGSLWGSWYGGALAILTDMGEDATLSSILIGGDLGLLTGIALARAHEISRSRARLASIAGVAGGLAGAGLDLLIQPSDDKLAVAIPLLTSTLGLALGAAASRGRTGGEARIERTPGPGEWDWRLGGPVVPTRVEGEGGSTAPGLALTLVSARF